MDYCKLSQEVPLVIAAFPFEVSWPEPVSAAIPGNCYAAIDLQSAFSLCDNMQESPKAACFYLAGRTVHIHHLVRSNQFSGSLPQDQQKFLSVLTSHTTSGWSTLIVMLWI